MAGLNSTTTVELKHAILLVISDRNYKLEEELKSLLEDSGLSVRGVDSIPGSTVYEELDLLMHWAEFIIFYCSEESVGDKILTRVIESIVQYPDTDISRCITLLSPSTDRSWPLCLTCTTTLHTGNERWKDELVSIVRSNGIKKDFGIRMTSKSTFSNTIMQSNLASESITYDMFGIRCKPRNEHSPESPVLKVNLDVFQREMASNSQENIIQICNTFQYFPSPELRLKLILGENETYQQSMFTNLATLFSNVCPLRELVDLEMQNHQQDKVKDETYISRLSLIEGHVNLSVETVVSNIYKSVWKQIRQAINDNINANRFLQSLKDVENRKKTFYGRWDESSELPIEFLASAGFFLNPFGRLICHYCQIMLNRSTEQRYIPTWHVTIMPNCQFAVKYQNDSIPNQNLAHVAIAPTNNAHLNYTLSGHRARSFEPILSKLQERFGPRCSDIIDLIAEAGFHYGDRSDFLRCYSCGRELSLIGLDKSNIWSLHAGMSPNCLHVLDIKGKQWVDDIQSARRDSSSASSVTFFLKVSGGKAIERSWHKNAMYIPYVIEKD